MSQKNEMHLSASFPGLVDVCETREGRLLYLIANNGEYFLQETVVMNGREFMPPDKNDFPFTLPQAEIVMDCINHEDSALYEDVIKYLKRFSGLDDHQWSVIVHFLFFTYLHDHADMYYAPILLFYAVPGRGKSRTGKSLTYLAFRGIHLNELREANILRYCENLQSTLFFDIMDVWKKAERNGCEDILLGRFEKGQKCSRVLYPEKGAFRDMKHYEVYGPTVIASNEPLHKILETRCLHISMPNLPGNYENLNPASASELKARLTAWRGRNLFTKLSNMQPIEGISGRLWDISKSLFLVNSLLEVESDLLREAILAISTEQSESQQDSFEGRLISIIKEIIQEKGEEDLTGWTIKTSEIVTKINQTRSDDRQLSSQWVGKKLKSMSVRHRTVMGRSEIQLNAKEYKTLLEQYGFTCRELVNTRQTLREKNQYNQNTMGAVGSCRVSEYGMTQELLGYNPEELDIYQDSLNILKQIGGKTDEEMKSLARENVEIRRKNEEAPF